MADVKYATPEIAHDALMDAIDYELDHYGAASLADMIASIVDARVGDEDSEDGPPDAQYWRAVRKAYQQLAWDLSRLRRIAS